MKFTCFIPCMDLCPPSHPPKYKDMKFGWTGDTKWSMSVTYIKDKLKGFRLVCLSFRILTKNECVYLCCVCSLCVVPHLPFLMVLRPSRGSITGSIVSARFSINTGCPVTTACSITSTYLQTHTHNINKYNKLQIVTLCTQQGKMYMRLRDCFPLLFLR